MNQDWKHDPRLKGMDEKKLKYLTEMAAKVESTPRDKVMPLLMNLNAGMGSMNFSDQETDLLVSIMTANMTPAQKNQVETLRTLSKRFGKGGKF